MVGKLRNMTSIYLYNEENEILMLYRIGSRVIEDSYIGTAGGHFEKDEINDANKCILRELYEETGLTNKDIDNIELKYVTLRYKDEEIRQNYYFFAKLIDSKRTIKSNEGELNWFKFNEIKKLNVPHTAKYVIEHYIKEGKNTNKIYGGIAEKDGINFIELKQFS